MGNIIDYLKWRGDLSLEQDPFNIVDNVILSALTYLPFEKHVSKYPAISEKNLVEVLNKFFYRRKAENFSCGALLSTSPSLLGDIVRKVQRYKDVKVCSYASRIDIEKHEQFSAVSFILNPKLIYISYKGTDDTLIGWQEDLDMIAKFPVKAQVHALHYIDMLMSKYPEAKFIIGGHSKGGNLAIYSAIYCQDEYKKRILQIYSNDGPGFDMSLIDQERFNLVSDKMVQIIPNTCVIGNFFDHIVKNRIIVQAQGSFSMDHSPFAWEITGKELVTVKKLDPKSRKIDTAFKSLLKSMDDEQRYNLLNCFYRIITNSEQSTLTEMKSAYLHAIKSVLTFDSQSRKIFFKIIGIFVKNTLF